ncbi:MAG: cell division protein FtsL [Nitrospinota bacterium]
MNRLLAFLARRPHEGPWYYLLCVPVLTAAVVALAWPRLHDLRLRYEYRSLRAQQEQLLRENRRLRLERAKLQSLSRIEAIARRGLGLADPKAGQVFWVDSPAIVKVPGGQP